MWPMLCEYVAILCSMYLSVRTRAVSVNALIYAINAAAINAIKYLNAIKKKNHIYIFFLMPLFTFSHLADAFIQSDLHMCDLQCIHFTFTLMAHCTSGAIRGSVIGSPRQGIELATFVITKRLLYLLYHCRPHHSCTVETTRGKATTSLQPSPTAYYITNYIL